VKSILHNVVCSSGCLVNCGLEKLLVKFDLLMSSLLAKDFVLDEVLLQDRNDNLPSSMLGKSVFFGSVSRLEVLHCGKHGFVRTCQTAEGFIQPFVGGALIPYVMADSSTSSTNSMMDILANQRDEHLPLSSKVRDSPLSVGFDSLSHLVYKLFDICFGFVPIGLSQPTLESSNLNGQLRNLRIDSHLQATVGLLQSQDACGVFSDLLLLGVEGINHVLENVDYPITRNVRHILTCDRSSLQLKHEVVTVGRAYHSIL